MKITLGSVPKHTLGCDMCDLGRAVQFASISWEEVGHMTGTVRRVLCSECFEREVESWSPFGDYAPERLVAPPVLVTPPVRWMGWPLAYRGAVSD